jgi:hypothetical protein
MGAMMPFNGPSAAVFLWGEGHAPLWQYLSCSLMADEPIAAPKGHGPLTVPAFPLQPAFSWDRRTGP